MAGGHHGQDLVGEFVVGEVVGFDQERQDVLAGVFGFVADLGVVELGAARLRQVQREVVQVLRDHVEGFGDLPEGDVAH